MNATRCKMKLVSLSDGWNGGVGLKFQPVQSGSEENKKFYEATPSGSVEFQVSATARKSLGIEAANLGSEFYFDITPCA
jgi:hypothetical protein